MRLRIKNIGRISEVDIKCDGITVLAGNNNTGKSTVGKSLFGIFRAFNNLSEQIEQQKQSLTFSTLHSYIHKEMGEESDYDDSFFVTKKIVNALKNKNNDREEVVKKFLKQVGVESEEIKNNIIIEYERIEEFPEEVLTKRVVTSVYQKLFNRSINSLVSSEDDASIEAEITGKKVSVTFKEDACNEFEKKINISNKAIYIDDPFVMDELDDRFSNQYTRRVLIEQLFKASDDVKNVLRQGIAEDRVSEALAVFDSIGLGDVYADESGDYKYRDSDVDIPVNNTSAGIKSFAIIKTLLSNGNLAHKDVLILDEPEIHLHPEWQLKYAQLIVFLQKSLDLTILITTHSQVFLEAIDLYSRKYRVADKCNYYFSYSDDKGNGFKEVTDGLDEIYSQMVDPSIELDKIRWELEDEADD